MGSREISRRRFLQGTLVWSAAAITACAATPASQQPAEGAPQAAVTVAAEVPAAEGGAAQIELWWGVGPHQQAVVQVFHEMQSDVRVELIDIGETVYGTPKFTTAVAAGEGPEVAYQNRHTFQQFSARGLYVPLDDYLERDGYNMDDFPPEQMKTLSWDGTVYGLPNVVDGRFFFWNRAHFEEAGIDPDAGPKTWDDILEYSAKLIKRSGDTIERFPLIPGFPPGLRDQLLIFALENGGETMDESGRRSLLDTDPWVEALDWCVKYTDEYCGGFEIATGTMQGFAGQAQDMFAAGVISMSSYGGWMIGNYSAFPDLDYDGTAEMPVAPHMKGTKINWNCDYSWAMTAKQGGNLEAGWTLVKFLISPEKFEAEATVGQQLAKEQWEREGLPGTPIYYAAAPGYRPSREWVAQNVYANYPERQRKMAESTLDCVIWGKECGLLGGLAATELWTEMATAWESALSHTLSPKEAMVQAQANHQRALDENWAKLEE